MTDDEKQKYKKLKWVWCHDCGGGSISKVGWAQNNRAVHNVCSLKAVGKEEAAIREFLFVERGVGRLRKHTYCRSSSLSLAVSGKAPPSPFVYTLNFLN